MTQSNSEQQPLTEWTRTLLVQAVGKGGRMVPVAVGIVGTSEGLKVGLRIDRGDDGVIVPIGDAVQLILHLRDVTTAVMYDSGMTGGESL